LVKWPGIIKPGSIDNSIVAAEDWMPTLLAGAGDPDVKEKLLKGMKVGDQTFRNHLDGYNFLPYFKGDVAQGSRHEFFYLAIARTSLPCVTTTGKSASRPSRAICSRARWT
jgi:arylsulfatase A-like enzyme